MERIKKLRDTWVKLVQDKNTKLDGGLVFLLSGKVKTEHKSGGITRILTASEELAAVFVELNEQIRKTLPPEATATKFTCENGYEPHITI